MSGWLSRRLVERGIIKEEEQEIYQFGIRNGMIILLALAVGIVMVCSPMHSKNRKLDEAEQKYFGRKAKVITVVQLIVLGVLWYMKQDAYAYAIYSSICITAVTFIERHYLYRYSTAKRTRE